MRFKGFFKEYWNMVFKPSIAWMKKYWLPYSIVLVIAWIISFCYVWCKYFGLDDFKRTFITKRTDDEVEDFLRWDQGGIETWVDFLKDY